MEKRPIIFALAALMLATLACTINVNVPAIQTTDTKTVTISEPLPQGVDLAKVSLSITAGIFSLSGGANGLVDGTIKYNVSDWQPVITRNPGQVDIAQGDIHKITGLPTKEVVNDWSLMLGDAIPLDLTIQAGAYQGVLDLGGLRLKDLTIQDGASQSKVTFSQPNPETLDNFSYKTGASQVDLEELANANASNFSFEGGAGDYTLDFSGNLTRDAQVSIKAGVSNITINVPAATHVIITNQGAISNINTQGTWVVNGSTYETEGQGPVITININIAVGNLKLVHETS